MSQQQTQPAPQPPSSSLCSRLQGQHSLWRLHRSCTLLHTSGWGCRRLSCSGRQLAVVPTGWFWVVALVAEEGGRDAEMRCSSRGSVLAAAAPCVTWGECIRVHHVTRHKKSSQLEPARQHVAAAHKCSTGCKPEAHILYQTHNASVSCFRHTQTAAAPRPPVALHHSKS